MMCDPCYDNYVAIVTDSVREEEKNKRKPTFYKNTIHLDLRGDLNQYRGYPLAGVDVVDDLEGKEEGPLTLEVPEDLELVGLVVKSGGIFQDALVSI